MEDKTLNTEQTKEITSKRKTTQPRSRKKSVVKKQKFDFNDILIEPGVSTDIFTRKNINSRYGEMMSKLSHLPLITAPMDTVVSSQNALLYLKKGVNVCLPRGERFSSSFTLLNSQKMIFSSYSLIEFTEQFIKEKSNDHPSHILIDIANGHMKDLLYITKKAKEMYGNDMKLMVGNVAHPETYKALSEAGADYIRCGIGNGNGCFIDGTKVLTKEGYKNIEDINDGDFVITHKGNYKEVISKLRYASSDEFLEINGIKCTKNHKFLVVNIEDSEKINDNNYLEFSFWLEAEKINENIHMLLEMENNVELSIIKIKTVKINKKTISSGNATFLNDITVKDDHSYVVSENNVIVHNCLTSENTGIGYPIASLIKECYDISKTLPESKRAKIVADGGMKSYSDVIKALALGANYVMVGSIFNKALESSGKSYWKKIPLSDSLAYFLYKKGFKIKKNFRGMSTKEVQKKWGKETLKTSEGVTRYRPVEYTLSKWLENFEDYLTSAMSYTNSHNLEEFVGKVKYNLISEQSYKRFNK